MTIARSRSRFSSHRPRLVPQDAVRHSGPVIILARTVAGGVLVGAIATASRLMYGLSWQTDGALAVIVAAGWMFWAECLMGGL
jgi:hypothetical protein